MMDELTQNRIKELLSYNPETGLFKWRVRTANRIKVGDVAGTLKASGYICIKINHKLYWAHRLVWLFVHGAFPTDQIDHINHVKTDNRLINLRLATHQQNQQNRPMICTNSSGFNGVSWCKRTRKWSASIGVSGKRIHLGRFTNKLDAIDARKVANIKYGFHENHGEGREFIEHLRVH